MAAEIKRVGMVVKLKPECVEEYRRLHAESNPGVRDLLSKYNMQNFSIFLHKIGEEWFEFGYYEYAGDDFEGDMVKLASEPRNQAWLEICDPMQLPLEGAEGWTEMERVYFNRGDDEKPEYVYWSEHPTFDTECSMLKKRLIDFAARIIMLSEALPETRAGRHISSQILRSGTSSAANYGEAQSAESRADFVHKLKLSLKELRETEVWLKVIQRAQLVEPAAKLDPLIGETDELIAILFTSVAKARSRQSS